MDQLLAQLAALPAEQRRDLLQRPEHYNLFALSHGQERLWFLDKVQPGTPNYSMPARIDFRGQLDVLALRAALEAAVQRHESLRTAFVEIEGVPMQFVQPPGHVLREADLSGLPEPGRSAECARRVLAEAREPFQLSAGHLFRSLLIRLDSQHHVLVLNVHHIVCDDWSIGVLMREIAALYGGFGRDGAILPPLTIQFADYAGWQREQLRDERLARLATYWCERLAGAPELVALPLDRPRPAVQSFNGARIGFELDASLTRRLDALARDHQCTLFMVAHAAFLVLLHRYCGQDDLPVATAIANRPTPELESMVGLFFNTLVLRTDCSGDPTFAQLLERVRSVALDAYAHQDLPFVKLVELLQPGRTLSHNPLVQVMFLLQNAPREDFLLPGVAAQVSEVDNGTAQFDLIVSLRRHDSGPGQGMTGYVHYSTDLFDAATMQRLVGHYRTLLNSVCAAPAQPLSALPMLTQGELQQVKHEWNDTAHPVQRGVCLHHLVEGQARRQPQQTAVIAGAQELSYGQLDERANRLAHRLLALGAGPGANVGICMRPGVDQVVTLLAVAKCGSAYVPLDPGYPEQRLGFMLRDAGIAVLATQADLLPGLPRQAQPVLCVDAATAQHEPGTPPPVSVGDDHLAYVIYTSGTTGQPKGVMIRHAGIVNNLLDLNQHFDVGPRDRVLALSSCSFDMFVYETFGILAAGGAVVVPDPDRLRDPAHWASLIRAHGVTMWNSAPALLEMLLRHVESVAGPGLPSLRGAVLGGDWVPVTMPARLERQAPGARFVVLGGATEASIHSIIYPVTATDPAWTSIPYGRPMRNQRAYVLDRAMQPVPVGVPGELYLGGLGLARGYHARPALTAEKFLPDPLADEPGARLYRTGDLARLREDGTIILIGRMDHQVKIRGHRIELGEVESVLRQDPGVRQAVVGARADATGEKQLVAWLVLHEGANPAAVPPAVLARARAQLPACMVPARVQVIERLPLSPNGKVDRQSLPAPDEGPAVATAGPAPATALQRLVANLFADVLGLGGVGLQADFFDLGGHSLRATQLTAQIRELLQIDLPLRDFLLAPNVAAVAAALEGIAAGRGVALEPIVAAFEALQDTDATPGAARATVVAA